MRSAPFGFMKLPMPEVFDLAADCAKLTHGHPSGYLAAGAFAVMIGASAVGRGLAEAVGIAREILARHAGHQETTDRLDQACQVARDSRWKDRLPELGEGWVAEEALAIAVLCALAADDPEEAVIAAVNHDGDSDSTGSIAGNLVGVVHGPGALPARWLDRLELREVIEMLGSDFADVLDERVDPEDLWDRYPGW
jgi:ADP-ribosyl-[dinitrogen reductase] hydrolase